MRLKITSDGTIDGTRVADADTGELVELVTSVEFGVCVDNAPYALITVLNPVLVVECEGEIHDED